MWTAPNLRLSSALRVNGKKSYWIELCITIIAISQTQTGTCEKGEPERHYRPSYPVMNSRHMWMTHGLFIVQWHGLDIITNNR